MGATAKIQARESGGVETKHIIEMKSRTWELNAWKRQGRRVSVVTGHGAPLLWKT